MDDKAGFTLYRPYCYKKFIYENKDIKRDFTRYTPLKEKKLQVGTFKTLTP